MNMQNAKTDRLRQWLAIRGSIGLPQKIISALLIWAIFFGLWEYASVSGLVNTLLVPAPTDVIATLIDLFVNRGFISDVMISLERVAISFALACAIAAPLGVLMGIFPAIEAFLNPFVSAWRYLPAPSFIPILLMWFGTGETPKLALLFIGVIFFLITLIMDHTKEVRQELIETGMTLGASRATIVRTVVVPAVLPNILTAMRQMLAVSWTYLVIAEIVASTDGIGAMMMRARRFLHTDEIMSGILVIGILGIVIDYLFRRLHLWLFPYLRTSKS
jgi:NitT/TauT family transport system permease protein